MKCHIAMATMELAQVPDVGHAPLLTEPAALEPIKAFLTRLD
jgi:hypothetical protein